MKLDLIATLEPEWNPLVQDLRSELDRLDVCFVLFFRGESGGQIPNFIQAAVLGEDGLQIECASDEFLEEPLSSSTKQVLKDLGWKEPGEDSPNYHIWLEPNRPNNDLVARFMVLTLRDAHRADSSLDYYLQY
jgi:hypothetical protein